MGAVIRADGLTKQFGDVVAVDDVSLRIERGEIYGFIGLNGAGKTTMIRMLLGMIRPTAGRAFVFGEHVAAGRRDVWADVGYMVETPHSYPELTVVQNLELVRRLRRVDNPRALDDIVRLLGLTPYRDRKAAHLSLGNRQRLGLAKALIHKPRLLLLDEPTNGLDPAGIVEIRRLLRDLAAGGVTIFLSSHLLGEVAKLTTRIGIVHDGRLINEVDSDSLAGLLRRRLLVQTRDDERARSALVERGYTVTASEGGPLSIRDERATARPEKVAQRLVDTGTPPVLLKVEEEDLEAFFLRTIGQTEEVRP